jgi:hypothetical protein
MDNEDVLRFMEAKFQHLENKLDEMMKRNQDEHTHFQTNFRELYNENKLQNDRHTAEREKIMTEIDAKLDNLGVRLSLVEKSVTTLEAEKRAAEKGRPVMISIIGLVVTALSFGSGLILRAIGG